MAAPKAVYTTSKIELWSTYLSMAACFSTHWPIQVRAICPPMKGTSSCTVIDITASQKEPASPCTSSNTFTIKGVSKIPIRLEAEALATAAATLPRAMAVKAMADCTVAGKAHKNSTPMYRVSFTKGAKNGFSSNPKMGNAKKVNRKIRRCKRQWVTPAMTAWRGNLAACKKNNNPMAAAVKYAEKATPSSTGGKKVATAITTSDAIVK